MGFQCTSNERNWINQIDDERRGAICYAIFFSFSLLRQQFLFVSSKSSLKLHDCWRAEKSQPRSSRVARADVFAVSVITDRGDENFSLILATNDLHKQASLDSKMYLVSTVRASWEPCECFHLFPNRQYMFHATENVALHLFIDFMWLAAACLVTSCLCAWWIFHLIRFYFFSIQAPSFRCLRWGFFPSCECLWWRYGGSRMAIKGCSIIPTSSSARIYHDSWESE